MLAFSSLKKILPELNSRVITTDRIFEILHARRIEFYELPFTTTNGCYAVDETKREYVILRRAMETLLFHETLCLESVHALLHSYAPFLLRKQQLEAETFALIAMMPQTDLPRLNRIKHQLDAESYDYLMRRNKANEIWHL